LALEGYVGRFFVRVDVEVETDDQRLIPVELEGRLLDAVTRPPGVRVANATVITIHEQVEAEE
jgi:hypothetical protein